MIYSIKVYVSYIIVYTKNLDNIKILYEKD